MCLQRKSGSPKTKDKGCFVNDETLRYPKTNPIDHNNSNNGCTTPTNEPAKDQASIKPRADRNTLIPAGLLFIYLYRWSIQEQAKIICQVKDWWRDVLRIIYSYSGRWG